MSPKLPSNAPVKKIKLKTSNLEFEAHEVPPWLIAVAIGAGLVLVLSGAWVWS